MPCYSTIQTVLIDAKSIEEAASKIGATVKKYSENILAIQHNGSSIHLRRECGEGKFQGSDMCGDYISLLNDLIPAYAKLQLKKFATAKGYTISQGQDQNEYVLTKYE